MNEHKPWLVLPNNTFQAIFRYWSQCKHFTRSFEGSNNNGISNNHDTDVVVGVSNAGSACSNSISDAYRRAITMLKNIHHAFQNSY